MMNRDQKPPREKISVIPLRLHVDLENYGSGEIEDSQSAIARPYRRLFEEGIDPGSISYVLIHCTSIERYKLLGALCETVGRRILFFPSGRIRRLTSRFNRESASPPSNLDGIVDHITFETNNYRRHLTEVMFDGKRRVALNLPQAPEVAQEKLYGWFGITLRSYDSLDFVPGKLWFSTDCPASDIDRRRELFRRLGNGSRVYALPGDPFTAEAFLQINFFIDLAPNQTRATIRTFLPNGPPELQETIETPATIKAQTIHGINLVSGLGATKIHSIVWPGAPTAEVAFGF
jgi:hypothetical protein